MAQNNENAPVTGADEIEQIFRQGQAFFTDHRYDEAVRCFITAAEQGHAGAQCILGACYEKGFGMAVDYTKAVVWYTKAAEQGLAAAQYNIGVCYENGFGIMKDPVKAMAWYAMAAKQGHEQANENLNRLRKSIS